MAKVNTAKVSKNIVKPNSKNKVKKYSAGKKVPERKWMFGGREAGDAKKNFVVFVKDRLKETVLSAIQKYIEPGTNIRSDGWALYNEIVNMNLGYRHEVVNHSNWFKDPVKGVHTNGIEGLWQKMKAHEKRNKNNRSTQESHVAEWWFLSQHDKPMRFYALLQSIAYAYPVE